MLYIVVDGRCGLCTEIGLWMRSQPAYAEFRTLSSESDEAKTKFPGLPTGELAVINDRGDVWLGDNAFLMCLWAMRSYRRWAYRLARPLLRPFARQAFAELSHNRHAVSKLLGLRSDKEIKEHLRKVSTPPCQIP